GTPAVARRARPDIAGGWPEPDVEHHRAAAAWCGIRVYGAILARPSARSTFGHRVLARYVGEALAHWSIDRLVGVSCTGAKKAYSSAYLPFRAPALLGRTTPIRFLCCSAPRRAGRRVGNGTGERC